MNQGHPPAARLGTFAGVFTPSVLTIVGLILFLRLGYVVGASGLPAALLILLLANCISVLTSISLSAISTNLRVKRGGDYYLISRTLGPTWGGAIGLVMFLAQSVSIAFYCLGFGEVVHGMLPPNAWVDPQIVAAIALCVLFVFAWLGTDWATRFQYVVMAIITVAIGTFFAGSLLHWKPEYLAQNWHMPGPEFDFWVMFALFFPAVTGFTQGVSMSGELKDPQRSLPLGTFLAVGISIVIYFVSALAFAAAEPTGLLVSDYGAMGRIASSETAVIAGVFAATLSSAMASFMGAPRILQSLASDRLFVFLTPFARTTRKSGNPRRGVMLAAAIALITVGTGQLNLIAPVVSMFFLISYGLINFATYFEAAAGSPAFRPTFRYFNRWLCLAGGMACLAAMLAIHAMAGAIAIAIMFAINQYLRHTAPLARWADGRRSYHLQQIREHMLATARTDPHPRDWRPNLLVFSSQPMPPGWLLQFAGWVIANSGFATAVNVLHGRGMLALKHREENQQELGRLIDEQELNIFPLTVTAPDPAEAIPYVIQSFGMGPLKANTILENWPPENPALPITEQGTLSARELQYAMHEGCNAVLLTGQESRWLKLLEEGGARTIDVWWMGDASSRFGLLLAYLITRAEVWNDAEIRLLGIAGEEEVEDMASQLSRYLAEVRIEAEPAVMDKVDSETVFATSRDASLAIIPFRIKKGIPTAFTGISLDGLPQELPPIVWVHAAEDFDLDAEPEEGRVSELTALRDQVEDSRKFTELTQREMEENEEKLARCQSEQETLQQRLDKDPDDEDLQEKARQLANDIEHLEELNETLFRRHARAVAKQNNAEEDAIRSGAIVREEPADSV